MAAKKLNQQPSCAKYYFGSLKVTMVHQYRRFPEVSISVAYWVSYFTKVKGWCKKLKLPMNGSKNREKVGAMVVPILHGLVEEGVLIPVGEGEGPKERFQLNPEFKSMVTDKWLREQDALMCPELYMPGGSLAHHLSQFEDPVLEEGVVAESMKKGTVVKVVGTKAVESIDLQTALTNAMNCRVYGHNLLDQEQRWLKEVERLKAAGQQ